MIDRFPIIIGGAIGVHALAAILLAQLPEQAPIVNEPEGDPLVVAELEFIEEYEIPEPEPPIEEPPPEPEPIPEPEIEEVVEPEPVPEPTIVAPPKPKPVAKPKPKPRPKPIAKPRAKPRPKPRAKAPSKPKGATKARPKSRIKPRYPKMALRKKLQGTTTVSASIGTNGRVTSASVSRSSGHASLDKAAVRAVKTTRFYPATRGGSAVAGSVMVPVSFQVQ